MTEAGAAMMGSGMRGTIWTGAAMRRKLEQRAKKERKQPPISRGDRGDIGSIYTRKTR